METTLAPVIVTEENRRTWNELGYFITDVVFDEETLEGVRADFKRMWGEEIENAKKTGDQLAIDWATLRPHMSQLDFRSQACKEFCRHPVFQELARQMLGPDADMTWNQAIVKAPLPKETLKTGKGWDNVFAWHQDIWYALSGEYAKNANMEPLKDPSTGITCWVAITRTTVDNGTLWVLPGHHKGGLVHHNMHQQRKEWQAQIDTSWKIPVVLRPGQVLVFQKYLPHSSGSNISDETRMAYQIGYGKPGLLKVADKNIQPLIRNGEPA